MKYEDYLETLSAGTDDYADAESVLQAIDRTGRQRWEEYHLIRQCLQNRDDDTLGLTLDAARRSRLRQALFTAERETPQPDSECASTLPPQIKRAVKPVATPQSLRGTTPPSNQSWFEYAAAAVGAVALAGFGVLMQSATSYDNGVQANFSLPASKQVAVVQPEAARILNASYTVAAETLPALNKAATAAKGVTPVAQRMSSEAFSSSTATASY